MNQWMNDRGLVKKTKPQKTFTPAFTPFQRTLVDNKVGQISLADHLKPSFHGELHHFNQPDETVPLKKEPFTAPNILQLVRAVLY